MENELVINGVRYVRADALLEVLNRSAVVTNKPTLAQVAAGTKRTPAELEKVKRLIILSLNREQGQSVEQLSRDLEMPTKDLTRPISQLKAAKLIRTRGVKRAMKYFVK